MSITCVVASCNSRWNADKGSAIKFFSFPKNPEIRKQWLHLCQINKGRNRKVCNKHFKEEDFVDGLKARLMCVQPMKLRKDALPSLFLNSETLSEESTQMQIENQETMLKKFKEQVSTIEDPNPSNNSTEYLSKLVPIAPKGQEIKRETVIRSKCKRIASKEANTTRKKLKIVVKESTEHTKLPIPKNPHSDKPKLNVNSAVNTLIANTNNEIIARVCAGFILNRVNILEHDNAIYRNKISALLDNQNKLLARIKKLELEIENEKNGYVNKIKKTFAKVFTSNQIENILGRKKRRIWTDNEYSVALKLFNISKQAYEFVKNEMNYPLPGIININNWSTKSDLKATQEKNKLNDDGNKGNRDHTTNDQIMLDDDHMINDELIHDDQNIDIDDVKMEIKTELIKATQEKNKLNDDGHKGNGHHTTNDQIMLDDNHMINDELIHDDQNIDNDDIKMEIKTEFVDENEAIIDQQDNENLDDQNAMKIDIDHEKIVSSEIKEENDDQESSGYKFILDHQIIDHGIATNDENEELYEELVFDDGYSDDADIILVYTNGEDNG